jgi:hypothetical protein
LIHIFVTFGCKSELRAAKCDRERVRGRERGRERRETESGGRGRETGRERERYWVA